MRNLLPVLLLAAAPYSVHAQSILLSTRVTPPAQLVHDGKSGALLPHKAIVDGDILRTGARGSAGMPLANDRVVTLGDSSELFVHSIEAAIPGRGPLLRLQLLRGDLQLEAYPPSKALPHDYRINIGPLRVRALGADLWAYANARGESVCLHQGAVEITGDAGVQRLDVIGDCVQHDAASGSLQLLEHAEAQIKDDLLNAGTGGVAVAASQHASQPAAPAPAKPAPAGAHWTVVLASFPDRASAEQAAHKLKRRGLQLSVVEIATPRAFRVTSGDYRNRRDASHAAVQLRRQHHLKSVWVAAGG